MVTSQPTLRVTIIGVRIALSVSLIGSVCYTDILILKRSYG